MNRARWSVAMTENVKQDSKQVKFSPRPPKKKSADSYRYWNFKQVPGQPHPKRECAVEISGVGSIQLLMQALLPYILYRGPRKDDPQTPLHLTVTGGTHVSKSPTLDYFEQVFVPTLVKLGYPKIEVNAKQRGWHLGPTVPGEVEFVIPSIPAGGTVVGFQMADRGEIVKYTVSYIVPQGASRSFKETVCYWFDERAPDVPMEIVKDEESGHASRFYLFVVAHTSNGYVLGRDWLYDRKWREPNKVADEMVKRVWKDLQEEVEKGGCVDEHLQDQLIVYQILADGPSSVDAGEWGKGSLHSQTVRWIGETVADVKWNFEDEAERKVMRCKGIGLISSPTD